MSNVIVWILSGCVAAGLLAWLNDVWTDKEISANLLIGMLLTVAMGWVGLAVFLLMFGLASLVHWFENNGSSTAISWGKEKEFPPFTDDQVRRLQAIKTLKTEDGDVLGREGMK